MAETIIVIKCKDEDEAKKIFENASIHEDVKINTFFIDDKIKDLVSEESKKWRSETMQLIIKM